MSAQDAAGPFAMIKGEKFELTDINDRKQEQKWNLRVQMRSRR